MRIIATFLAALLISGVALRPGLAGAATIRIGVLKFGTVSWELDTITANGLDAKHGVTLDIRSFAGEDASAIAFRAGEVDMIVTDWIEVARMRGDGEALSFAPYSTATGAIMVPAASPIRSIADLKGVRLAIAGGPFDKGWLLLQAMARKAGGPDLAGDNSIVYGAPPLLAEKLRDGEFDAALNYWQFNARLQADGYRRIVGGEEAANALGAAGPVSTLGYVFREAWADANRDAVLAFLAASRDAKSLLKASDAEWERLALAGVIRDSGAALAAIRDQFRRGIPERSVADEQDDARRLFAVLRAIGGERLAGKAETLPDGTYWPALTDGN